MEHLGWGPVAQRLMGPLVVVKPEVGAQLPPGLGGVGVGFQIQLLVLHGAPKPLHEDVVAAAPLPIHADLHPVFLKRLDELPAGELADPSLRWGKMSRPTKPEPTDGHGWTA